MKWIDNMIRKEEIETREEMDRNEWFVKGKWYYYEINNIELVDNGNRWKNDRNKNIEYFIRQLPIVK